MPSPQSIPRICINSLDGPPCSLPSSGTVDIGDILSPIEPLPSLLAEVFASEGTDDVFHSEEDHSKIPTPPFPMERRPHFFTLHCRRTRLLFRIRTEGFELGDFPWDEEESCPLLTAPTVPRMRLMMEERLYVQKWIDVLTSNNPPNHIPWVYEKPASRKDWIAEGFIFPAVAAKRSMNRRGATQKHALVVDANRCSGSVDQMSHPGALCAFSEASSVYVSMNTLTPITKSADANSRIFRGEPETMQTSQVPPPATLSPNRLAGIRTVKSNIPLAARRGKPLSQLKLKGSVIQELEYPDIPTAFLGSSNDVSPRFDGSSGPPFTDHESMLLDLKSKCATLGSGMSTYIQESSPRQAEMLHTSLSVDEWAFARGLATFDDNFSGNDSLLMEILVDSNIFLPDDSSTPVKRSSFVGVKFASRIHSLPVARSSVEDSCDLPVVPVPHRPALVSPSTPPHVRGILKKAKNVRFKDMIDEESRVHSLPLDPLAQVSRELPLPSAVRSERLCTHIIPEVAVVLKNVPRPQVPAKRNRLNGKRAQPAVAVIVHGTTSSRPGLTSTPIQRPCRIAHIKENSYPVSVTEAQARQKGSSDTRRGFEGLSVPLRNIFRFR